MIILRNKLFANLTPALSKVKTNPQEWILPLAKKAEAKGVNIGGSKKYYGLTRREWNARWAKKPRIPKKASLGETIGFLESREIHPWMMN